MLLISVNNCVTHWLTIRTCYEYKKLISRWEYPNVTWLFCFTTKTNPNPNPKPSYSKLLVPEWSEHHHHKKTALVASHLLDPVQSGVVNVNGPRQHMPSVPQRFCCLRRRWSRARSPFGHVSCTVSFDISNIAIFGYPSSVYPRRRGSPETIFVKFCMVVNRWLCYNMV